MPAPWPAPRHLALVQRRQNTHRAIQTGAQIGHCQARAKRPAGGVARHTHQTAHALDDLVKPGPFGIGAILPKARNAGQDDARVDLRQVLVTQAQLVLDIGTPVLHQHIGLGHQAHQDVQGAGLFQVEGERAFVAVQVLKVPAIAVGCKQNLVGVHARRRLDADHSGTKVSQHANAVGAGAHAG